MRLLSVGLLSVSGAWAQNASIELTELKVLRDNGSLVLNAQLSLELGPVLEDALAKGLALHFVAEAEILRDRWYWTDAQVSHEHRYYRLAFQPLTRRWRLNVSSEPIAGTGLAGSISQNFETLGEALSVIRRQSAWRLVDLQSLSPDARQRVRYNFKLDVSQLPRPFQIAAGGQTDWNLQVSRTLRLSLDMVR
ncbi:DUF4390 domain-containing protein [Limnohabitans sp.]|uniref:DUF4390 domain-containing protein n=1 Tax=Limnohabitans sp. TaxID=1907725 RepID=UPI0039BD340F|nr:DUF4390 domain-containing protein [Comamonadaceae bacterium]